MKKTVCIIMLAAALVMSVFAGDIPEQLLKDDSAQIFFGELVSYNSGGELSYAEVVPRQKIKGDVLLQTNGTYQGVEPIGGFEPQAGEVYLFAYSGGNGYFFETTSQKPKSIQLRGTVGDMWERFEGYLADREYEIAEAERLSRLNQPESVGEKITLAKLIGVPATDAERVTLHYSPHIEEVDKDEFYALAEKIILTDIENEPMQKRIDEKTFKLPNGIAIMVNGFDGYAFVSDDCTVDKYGMHMSRLPVADYIIEEKDLQALRKLFPEEIRAQFENRTDNTRYYISAAVFALALILAAVGSIVSFRCKK